MMVWLQGFVLWLVLILLLPFVLAEETCSALDYRRLIMKGEVGKAAGTCKRSNLEILPLIRLKSDQVGEVQFVAPYKDAKPLKLITRSLRPLLFEIPNFLLNEECSHIIKLAELQGLNESYTQEDNNVAKKQVEDDTTAEGKQRNCDELMEHDTDRDGSISPKEFALLFESQTGIEAMADELHLAFSQLDKDSDGYTTIKECILANHTAVDQLMRNIEEEHPRYRDRFSRHTWLNLHHSSDPVLKCIHERVVGLIKLPKKMVQRSELLQVVRYTKYGHYHAHYDSLQPNEKTPCCDSINPGISASCKLCRYLTILYYLNDVPSGGETAFPVADNATFSEKVLDDSNLHNLSTHCQKANLIVKPKKGMALLWYNHLLDQATGRFGPGDEFSLHGGCDVKEGVKWIANTWIN